tara:strand:- start:430 stop:612 length:183 start_codon:yes stop_codon:yes gene_type:complete
MLNDKMKSLVDALEKTHQGYIKTVVSNGGIDLKASQLGRKYKDIQREMIVVDIVDKKEKY